MLTPTDTGLICAYKLGGEEPPASLDWGGIGEHDPEEGFMWIHMNMTLEPARRWLRDQSGLEEEQLESLLDPDVHGLFEILPRGIIISLKAVHYDMGTDTREVGLLRLLVEPHRVITLRRHPLRATNRLRRQIEQGDWPETPSELVAGLVEQLAEDIEGVVRQLSEELDYAEDALLLGRMREMPELLGTLRRELVQLRRHMAPQRYGLIRLISRLPRWFGGEEKGDLREAAEHLASVIDDLDAVQERAKLLQEEFSSKLSEETNHNLYILSAVTVVMLPMTLITGIFGMNVAGMPGMEDHRAFWFVCLGMVAVGLVTILLLRRKHLF